MAQISLDRFWAHNNCLMIRKRCSDSSNYAAANYGVIARSTPLGLDIDSLVSLNTRMGIGRVLEGFHVRISSVAMPALRRRRSGRVIARVRKRRRKGSSFPVGQWNPA